jgi:hypothetical protein
MQVKGNATALSATTQFTDATAVWVFNTGTAGAVTVRNTADDGDVGTIYVGAGAGIVIHLSIGEGLRGAAGMQATQITATGY